MIMNLANSVEMHCNFTEDCKMMENFDSVLKEKWEEAQKNGVFRYILNIRNTKILDGKYRFLVQLNIDRGTKRRHPANMESMNQPFDENSFQFLKLRPEEELMRLNGEDEDVIAINDSPLEYCHSLLIPQRSQRLQQIVTKYSLHKAFQLFSLSSSTYLRLGFNSLWACASINHLHWHLYYLSHKMTLEYITLADYAGPVKTLGDYPAKGFCIKYSTVGNVDELVNWTYLIAKYLQDFQIAHNIYITKARMDLEEECNDLRVYIWARKSRKGAKLPNTYNVAACELFGHFSIKSEEVFENLTEDYIIRSLLDETEEIFNSVYEEIKNLITDRINKDTV